MSELINYYPFKIFVGVLIFLLGAAIGSFSMCMADRYGKDKVSKRSRCDSCGKILGPLELIPIFSYIFLKGKCKSCDKKIGPLSIIVEIFSAVIYLMVFIRYEFSIQTIFGLIIYPILLIPALIDFRLMIIPNLYPILLLIVWIPYLFFVTGPINILGSLLGGVLIPGMILLLSIIMGKILKKETFGMGDIKILIGTGLILGFFGSFINVFLMSIIGLVVAIVDKKSKNEAFPLMPSICISTMLTYVFGSVVEASYKNLF